MKDYAIAVRAAKAVRVTGEAYGLVLSELNSSKSVAERNVF